MNLPNYFLADLPAEASLTPTLITEACQTLRRNRQQYLISRSTSSIIQLLDSLGREWLDTDSPFRAHVLEQGPAKTGFAQRTLQHGLDSFFKQLTTENLEAFLKQELGNINRLDGFHDGSFARGP
ncbi:MAG: acyl-CoA reductase, partial [Limisphaerales bacterium]